MRLLRNDYDDMFSLVEFTGSSTPPYAILSHTWGADHEEVTYQDLVNGRGQDKIGYNKIRFCAQQAAKDELRYFWVDTCCIDKSSSAELTESINSMFRWYREANVCYVMLQDLLPDAVLPRDLSRCRWFSRGWTLQELLSPKHVLFYDSSWTYIGNKETLADLVSAVTGISKKYIVDKGFLSASSATKMSWAAQRETKRIEDRAYSLLGIFDVNMPLIYGEGSKAFRRLQEEIIKRSNDLTIFAWEPRHGQGSRLTSPLADSPEVFADRLYSHQHAIEFAEFSITNKGLLLGKDIPLRTADARTPNGRTRLYLVYLGGGQEGISGMYLRKVGPHLFCREGQLALVNYEQSDRETRTYEVDETYVLFDIGRAHDMARLHRTQGIHVPVNGSYSLQHTYPQTLWDDTDRMFLRPKRFVWADFPMVLILKFAVTLNEGVVSLAVLCHHLSYGPILKIFSQDQYPQEYELISQARYKQDGIHVQELDLQARSIRAMGDSIRVKAGTLYHHISVSLRPEVLETFFGAVNVSVLSFKIDGLDTQLVPLQPAGRSHPSALKLQSPLGYP